MAKFNTSNRPFTRRGFLRGAGGLALTLPWLESLPLAAKESAKPPAPSDTTDPSRPPVRLACLFFSNGVEPAHWWAKGRGAAMEIGPGLAPMQAHREEMIFLRGLFNEQAVKHKSAHLGRSPNLLSGAWVSTDQNEIRVGRTMDQVLAQQIGRRTAVPSLALGIEPTELRLEDGLSMLYGSCISWASETRPATKEIYPARVFDLLVEGGANRRLDRSILDQVQADARDLSRQMGSDDRRKLDEYLQSIRDIERRLDTAVGPRSRSPTCRGPATNCRRTFRSTCG